MIQTTEELVYQSLTTNKYARQDDFILYGAVLKKLGVDLHKRNARKHKKDLRSIVGNEQKHTR